MYKTKVVPAEIFTGKNDKEKLNFKDNKKA